MRYIFQKRIIRDDIELSHAKTDRFKTSVLKMSIAVPNLGGDDRIALFGLMVNLLRCGTEKYPEKADIIKRLGDLYDASCSIGGYASGDNQIFEISSEMLSDRFSDGGSIFEGIVELMDQIFFHPCFDENSLFKADTVEREKRVLCDKIKSEKNNSREYAFKRCREIMCEGEPYGRSIKPECLEKITSYDLSSFYREFLAGAEISFSYVGDKDIDDVSLVLYNYFKREPIGTAMPLIPMSCKRSFDVREKTEDLDIKQGVLVMGFRSGVLLGSENAHIMRVFNNIYGGTCTSRLFKTVREQMSLCYYCDSDYVNTKGILFVSCGVDVSNRDIAQREILKQLDILKNEHVTIDELEAAKDMALKELLEMKDYPGAVAAFRYVHEIYGCDTDIDEIIERIRTVTVENVMSVAKSVALDTVFFLKGTAQPEDDEYDDI